MSGSQFGPDLERALREQARAARQAATDGRAVVEAFGPGYTSPRYWEGGEWADAHAEDQSLPDGVYALPGPPEDAFGRATLGGVRVYLSVGPHVRARRRIVDASRAPRRADGPHAL